MVTDMAVQCSKLVKGDPYTYIPNFTPAVYWLSELHRELVKDGSIQSFRNLPKEEKLRYWTAVCMAAPTRPKFIRVLACYACYVYDLITKTIQ